MLWAAPICSVRRSPLRHSLSDLAGAGFNDGDSRRDRRRSGARGPRGSPLGEIHLAACNLGVAARGAPAGAARILLWTRRREAPPRHEEGPRALGRRMRRRCDPRSLRMGCRWLWAGRLGRFPLGSRRLPRTCRKGPLTAFGAQCAAFSRASVFPPWRQDLTVPWHFPFDLVYGSARGWCCGA
jgi:hypothetical protein